MAETVSHKAVFFKLLMAYETLLSMYFSHYLMCKLKMSKHAAQNVMGFVEHQKKRDISDLKRETIQTFHYFTQFVQQASNNLHPHLVKSVRPVIFKNILSRSNAQLACIWSHLLDHMTHFRPIFLR